MYSRSTVLYPTIFRPSDYTMVWYLAIWWGIWEQGQPLSFPFIFSPCSVFLHCFPNEISALWQLFARVFCLKYSNHCHYSFVPARQTPCCQSGTCLWSTLLLFRCSWIKCGVGFPVGNIILRNVLYILISFISGSRIVAYTVWRCSRFLGCHFHKPLPWKSVEACFHVLLLSDTFTLVSYMEENLLTRRGIHFRIRCVSSLVHCLRNVCHVHLVYWGL